MDKNNKNRVYKIGEVADMFGIHPDTLRNWEKDGVIVPARIGKRGDRRYAPEHIKKIQDEGLVTSIVKKTEGKNKNYSQYSKKRLIDELDKLKKQKKFGLVWEDKDEAVVEQCKKEAPILKHIKNRTIKTDKDKPSNILIEGDNYHALQVLNYTHKGKIDVIYIDPPYNTGAKDWKYDNNYVDSEDGYKHSKWISMMKNRLKLAKNLLSKRGFIIFAIDHHELFYLGVLCDEIFGENNRAGVVTVVHNPKGRNLSNFFSENSEFMLVYAKNIEKAKFNDVAIDEDVRETFNLTDADGRYRIEPFMRARTETLRKNKPKFYYPIYVSADLKKLTTQKINGFHEIFPNRNGKSFTWKTLPKTFEDRNKDEYFVVEKKDNEIQIFHKYREKQIFKNVWIDKKYQSEFNGTNLLKEILTKKIFDYPKSVYLVLDILKIITQKNSIILDFFAGSGTTGHAVLELNKEDGGNRKFILCTNNEGKIAEKVTYPRIKKVIKGYKKNGNGEKVEGLSGNLEYLKTEFVNVDNINKVSDKKKLEFTHEAGEMIALKEDCFQEVIKNKHYQVFTDGKDKYVGIYFRENTEKLVELESRVLDKNEVKLYIFSHSGGSDWKNDYEEYKKVIVEDIPEPILKVYKSLNS